MFNAPWAPSDETTIVHSDEKVDETKVQQSKKLTEKVLFYIITINGMSDVFGKLWMCYQKFLKSVELEWNSMTMH